MFKRRASASAPGGRASLRPTLFLPAKAFIRSTAEGRRTPETDPDQLPVTRRPRAPRRFALLVLFSPLLLIGTGLDAEETPLSGPLTVTETLLLSADIRVPSEGIGLKITASDVRIDLNGHEILGHGTGTGISIEGQRNVVVTNGRVRGCARGLVLNGGGKHQITSLVIQGHGGDGIQIVNSEGNNVTGCTILDNARMGLLLQGGSGNRILDNRLQRNRGPGDCGGITLQYSSNNEISNNTLRDNGAWGMRLLEASAKNLITGNVITDTRVLFPADQVQPGQPAVSWQPGLILNSGTTGNDVRANVLSANGFGLFLWAGAVDNNISGNKATDNHRLDLVDLNKTCAVNTWTGNQFGLANHFCDH